MIKCEYKNVQTIINHYGHDWSNLILEGANFIRMDLTNIILPNDPELFQKINHKSLFKTKLPKGDYSKYNFEGVRLYYCQFTEDSIFSLDKEILQKIENKSIEGTRLPKGDYSEYNFCDVRIEKCRFTADSIFSKDNNVLQKIKDKELSGVYLPKGDYSSYDFNDVNLYSCKFTLDSIFSSDKEVFQKIRYRNLNEAYMPVGDYRFYNFKNVYIGNCCFSKDALLPEHESFFVELENRYNHLCEFTYNIVKNIHNYNLAGVQIDLSKEEYKSILNKKQIDILKAKYTNAIGNAIKLPDEVFGEEEHVNYEF